MTAPRIVNHRDGRVTVFNGEESYTLHRVHRSDECVGRPCVIHRPTNHAMREWTLWWYDLGAVFYRDCPEHGTAHPDPDQFEYWRRNGEDDKILHVCCGCCGINQSEWFFGGPHLRCLNCGDVIHSKYRHNMVWCSCGEVAIDGGSAYTRIVGNAGTFEMVDDA